MANLGSEMVRMFSLKEEGSVDLVQGSADRSLKIIEQLLIHPEIKGVNGEVKILKNELPRSKLTGYQVVVGSFRTRMEFGGVTVCSP